MSKWVVMQTIDGCSQPVAIRNDEEAALATATKYAQDFAKKPGKVRQTDMGSVLVHVDASFLALEVEDVE